MGYVQTLSNALRYWDRYVGGRNDAQLRGIEESPSGLKSCDPELYLGGNTSEVIDPCGIVAWSYFNDTYQVMATVLETAAMPCLNVGTNWSRQHLAMDCGRGRFPPWLSL